MSHPKHRRKLSKKRRPFRAWLMASVVVLISAGFLVACASGPPSQAAENPAPKQTPSTEWKPMAVPGLVYACDPTLGIIIKHQWQQGGMGSNAPYDNWVISVIPYSQTTSEQEVAMCGNQR